MTPNVAVAFCAHHRPSLMMASLITALAQDLRDTDFHILFNEGDGYCPDKPTYAEYVALSDPETHRRIVASSIELEDESRGDYARLASAHGVSDKLSPFDQRLREVCDINLSNIFFHEFENDHSLDSGAWLKFIRSGAWHPYDYVIMIQEGTLLTSRYTISAALEMAARHGIHFLAGGHMKGRLGKSALLNYNPGEENGGGALELFHNRMIAETLDILSRDPDLGKVLDRWPEELPATRQFHVRDFEKIPLFRLLSGADPDRPLMGTRLQRRSQMVARRLPWRRAQLEYLAARAAVGLRRAIAKDGHRQRDAKAEEIIVDYQKHRVSEVVEVHRERDLFFHKEPGAEWFGCGCNHMFSRTLLERLAERFERYGLYDVLDLPFAGTALEVFWAFVPAWLGFEKWFFDGFHRVTKDSLTKRREDSPEGMAINFNRYYFGDIAVAPAGDFLKIKALHRNSHYLKEALGESFF